MTPTPDVGAGTVTRRGPVTLGDLAAAEKVTPADGHQAGQRPRGAGPRRPAPAAPTTSGSPASSSPRTAGRSSTGRTRRRNAWLAQRFARLTEAERVALAEAVAVIERLNREEVDR